MQPVEGAADEVSRLNPRQFRKQLLQDGARIEAEVVARSRRGRGVFLVIDRLPPVRPARQLPALFRDEFRQPTHLVYVTVAALLLLLA